MERRAPSLAEFRDYCRREFAFLTPHGFAEVASSGGEKTNPFQIAFARDETKIVIAGEGYGTVASTVVLPPDGRRIAPAQLAPDFVRKEAWRKRAKLSQLEQISHDAALLQAHGAKLWSNATT